MAQLEIVSTKRISKTSHSQKLQVVTYGVQKYEFSLYFTNFIFSAKEEENSQKKVTIQIISSNFL